MATKKDKKGAAPTEGSVRKRVEITHQFTVEEYKDKTGELTRMMQRVEQKEDEIKAQAAVAKAEVKELKAQVKEMANHIRNGSEPRLVNTTVEFDRKKGLKRHYLNSPGTAEHGNMVLEAPMNEDDYAQLPLPAAAEPLANPVLAEGAKLEVLEGGKTEGLNPGVLQG